MQAVILILSNTPREQGARRDPCAQAWFFAEILLMCVAGGILAAGTRAGAEPRWVTVPAPCTARSQRRAQHLQENEELGGSGAGCAAHPATPVWVQPSAWP